MPIHDSIMLQTPIEFINVVPVNPLISRVQIKVCYVSDEPNRNRSIITKDVARMMANSLPGSPIVGHYDEAKQDFDEHNRLIKIANGEIKLIDDTRPYGFVDLNAKVWFQKFLDDGQDEREYLMTEGYLWTGQYPEAQRVVDKGNNQSMELDENTLNATWTKSENGKNKFFIINEAIISKLCLLGEDIEPCFEGASVTAPKIEFSYDEGFKNQLFSMIAELKELLNEGGEKEVFTTYAVEIGDSLWSALWKYLDVTYPGSDDYCSAYRIEGIYEENAQKFAILQNRADMKYYRLNFALSEENGFEPSETLIEVTKSYVPAEAPQFAEEAVATYETEYKNQKNADNFVENEDNKIELPTEDDEATFANKDKEEEPEEDEEKCPECGKPVDECECEEDEEEEDKKKYSLEEIPEYVELQTKYSELEANYNALVEEKAGLEEKVNSLTEFKASIDKKEKKAMIDQFYMLSEEDKQDVINNIDTYSLEDIEAKLAIICVRNKVSFGEPEDKGADAPTIFNLETGDDDVSTPAWVKRAISVAKNMK